MSEVLRGIVYGTDEIIEVHDEPALESAALFKLISDEVWKHHNNPELTYVAINGEMPPDEAYSLLRSILESVDKELLVSDLETGLKVAEESPQLFSLLQLTPKSVSIETYNWDEHQDHRVIDSNGERKFVMFADGYRDYGRELGLSFSFEAGENWSSITYSVQRLQGHQHLPATMSVGYWDHSQASTGYEGSQILRKDLTPEQELRLLQAFQVIGGFVLDAE